jgi:hypothetical protein
MTDLRGTIKAIDFENNNGNDKKVVHLEISSHQILFIEFQGQSTELVKPIHLGKKVEIKILYRGKVSKIGRKYNNIIGKSINTIENGSKN